jgi:hypothetical protein
MILVTRRRTHPTTIAYINRRIAGAILACDFDRRKFGLSAAIPPAGSAPEPQCALT